MKTIVAGVAAALAVIAGLAALGGGTPRDRTAPSAQPSRHVVLLSGRDDHGGRQLSAVPLLAAPRTGADTVASLPDGTLVQVQEVSGTWVLIRSAASASDSRAGWVDDYRLRGVVHLVGGAPSCRPWLNGRPLQAGEQATVLAVRGSRVQVKLVRRPTVTGWLPSADVRELPPTPQNPCPGVDQGSSS